VPKNFSFSKDINDANFEEIQHELLPEENKREYLDRLHQIVTSIPKFHEASHSLPPLTICQYIKDQKKMLSDFMLSPELEITYSARSKCQVRTFDPSLLHLTLF
jgi:hypothetical protein